MILYNLLNICYVKIIVYVNYRDFKEMEDKVLFLNNYILIGRLSIYEVIKK